VPKHAAVRIITQEGYSGWSPLKKAEEAIARGAARQRADGIVEYIPADRALRNRGPIYSPTQMQPMALDVQFNPRHEQTFDSGFSTQRYPLPEMTGISVSLRSRFPSLARMGGGL
jgi:hypothetical protein